MNNRSTIASTVLSALQNSNDTVRVIEAPEYPPPLLKYTLNEMVTHFNKTQRRNRSRYTPHIGKKENSNEIYNENPS